VTADAGRDEVRRDDAADLCEVRSRDTTRLEKSDGKKRMISLMMPPTWVRSRSRCASSSSRRTYSAAMSRSVFLSLRAHLRSKNLRTNCAAASALSSSSLLLRGCGVGVMLLLVMFLPILGDEIIQRFYLSREQETATRGARRAASVETTAATDLGDEAARDRYA